MTKSVLVSGSSGYIGSALAPDLANEYNVTKYIRYNCCFDKPDREFDIVIHLAAHVGGIATSSQNQIESLIENIDILSRVIKTIPRNKIKKDTRLILVSSACSYPDNCEIPFNEICLHDGKPNNQVYGYGYAKRIMSVLADLSEDSNDHDVITLILTNVYGVYNNSCETFDPIKSHVTGALIKKFIDAKQSNLPNVTLWGDGSATRDFVHIRDVVNAILIAAKSSQCGNYNIANGEEISIRDLAELIKKLTNYNGAIIWDTTAPSGASRRCLDINKAKSHLGWYPSVNFENGLKEEIEWYKCHTTNHLNQL